MKPQRDGKSMATPRHSTSNSFLVRVWQESGEGTDLRFYIRDLKTGEERYLGDAQQIGELLTRGLRGKEPAESRREETA